MATIAYRVESDGNQWSLIRNGAPGMSYLTQEAAFEVAVGEAGGDLRHRGCGGNRAGARDRSGDPIEGDAFR